MTYSFFILPFFILIYMLFFFTRILQDIYLFFTAIVLIFFVNLLISSFCLYLRFLIPFVFILLYVHPVGFYLYFLHIMSLCISDLLKCIFNCHFLESRLLFIAIIFYLNKFPITADVKI